MAINYSPDEKLLEFVKSAFKYKRGYIMKLMINGYNGSFFVGLNSPVFLSIWCFDSKWSKTVILPFPEVGSFC